MQRRDELFEIPDEEPEMLHSVLSKLPKPLDLEGLIKKALILLEKYPPEKLSTWKQISNKSVLKTSRQAGPSRLRKKSVYLDLRQAEDLLLKQASEVERRRKMKDMYDHIIKYKPQAVKLGITVIVGVSAVAIGFYLSKDDAFGLGPPRFMRSILNLFTGA